MKHICHFLLLAFLCLSLPAASLSLFLDCRSHTYCLSPSLAVFLSLFSSSCASLQGRVPTLLLQWAPCPVLYANRAPASSSFSPSLSLQPPPLPSPLSRLSFFFLSTLILQQHPDPDPVRQYFTFLQSNDILI